jgi:cysteine desulfurase
MPEIYMDYNATTPVREEVLETLALVMKDGYANASSVHTPGRRAKFYLDQARERVAASIGARPSEIVFTAGGSESDNLAIKGSAWARGGGHIVTSSIEHPAVLQACSFLQSRGFTVTAVPADRAGRVSAEAVADALRDDTVLISIMWANNETGVLQPVDAIAGIARERGILFHTDAVQAFGKIAVNVQDVPVDMLAIAGHKFYAPKGVGALYVRRGTIIDSLVHGGGQEKGRRSGTESIPAIAALGTACELAAAELDTEPKRLSRLRDGMEELMTASIGDVTINGADAGRLPNTSNITFAGAEGEAILISLDEYGIAASSASACSAGHTEPSHVLSAMGLSKVEAECTMRFSLGKYSTDEDISLLASVLPKIVERLRALTR